MYIFRSKKKKKIKKNKNEREKEILRGGAGDYLGFDHS